MIAYELARCFRDRGHDVDVFATWSADPFHSIFSSELGIRIETDPDKLRPFHYDLVYFQHHTAPLFRYDADPGDLGQSMIVFGRLARRTFMESGGWAIDLALGDHTIANSELTAERLVETGVQHPISVFYNAAPESFFAAPHPLPTIPRRILLISNHHDSDLLIAVGRLRAACEVTHIGRSGEKYSLVTPDLIKQADLVISIGKSIPYALAARTPAYVYDHFGGPGYLRAENFQMAARFNFSGRCCERKLSGEQIFNEIITGYEQAADFTRATDENILGRYRLEAHVDKLLSIVPRSNNCKRDALSRHHGAIERERLMAGHIRGDYVADRERDQRAAAL